MRQFDNYNSYLDNLGLPLVGRVIFCDAQGVECNVTDSNGKVLGSTVFTTSSGRLSKQVFLYNHDYIVKFEKYVGSTSMNDDVEDDSWELQYEAKNLYGIVDINVNTVGIQGVKSIEDLRRLDPVSVESDYGSRIVNLLGYNDVGDKPSVSYYWDAECTVDDNDGSVIQYNGISGKGRWVIVDDLTYIDVRHFGAFPTDTPRVSMSQRMDIQNAFLYAQEMGKELYFHADDNGAYYDISGLNINGVSTSKLARLYCINGAESSVSCSGDAYFYGNIEDGVNGTIHVYGKSLKTSFDVASTDEYSGDVSGSIKLYPSESLVFDTDYPTNPNVGFRSIDVVLETNQSHGMTLTDCRIIGNGKIVDGICSFDNCNIRESMFDSGYNYMDYCNFKNCKCSRGDWSTDEKYEAFITASGDETATNDLKVFGDMYARGKSFFWEQGTFEKGLNVKCVGESKFEVDGKSEFDGQADFKGNVTGTGYTVLNHLEVKNPIVENFLVEEHIIELHEMRASAIDKSWFDNVNEVHVTLQLCDETIRLPVSVPDIDGVGKVLKISATRLKPSFSLDAKVAILAYAGRGGKAPFEAYAFVERGYVTFKTNELGWYIDRFG